MEKRNLLFPILAGAMFGVTGVFVRTLTSAGINNVTLLGLRVIFALLELGILILIKEMSGLPISTLRYYDKEGLFPDLERANGIRRFSDQDLEALNIIECLKLSGLEIKDIRTFMKWCAQGPSTYEKRRQLFLKQKESVEAEMERLGQVLDMIKFKCWYYETAIADGNEDRLNAMLPDCLPEEAQKLYDHGHGQKKENEKNLPSAS